MREFFNQYGYRLIFITPLAWLSINWLIDGHIIAFLLTIIFIVVLIGLWEDKMKISDEEE